MAVHRKAVPIVAGFLALCLVLVLLATGCQSENRIVSTETSSVCPNCQMETRVQPITGLKYTTCICPSCKKVSTLDPDLLLSLERFTGGPVGETVTVCDNCKMVIEQCAACRAKKG
jgi:hypothetical protein